MFDAYSDYYDLFYREKNYLSEANYVGDSIKAINSKSETILEFGSGTGRHGRALAELGWRVDGLEKSRTMLMRAQAGKHFAIYEGDIRSASMNRKYDAVVALFHVFSYQVSNDDVLATLANAAKHLGPGGIFMFDFWYGPAVLSQRATPRVTQVSSAVKNVYRIAIPEARPNENSVEVKYTIVAIDRLSNSASVFDERHVMRYFSLPEIHLLSDVAGFRIVKAEEFLTRAEPSERSWSVCCVLQKAG